MKPPILIWLAVSGLLLIATMALVSPTQAQDVGQTPTIEVLESSPESVFVFDISPDTAQVGQYPVFVMYAWGYLGDPTQALTITTTIPAGVDIGGCPDGCVNVMHLERDPWGGAGISATLNATATMVGQHTLVAYFEDDLGVSQTLSATITVVEPPTAVRLSKLGASPAAPKISWMTIALALLLVVTLSLLVHRHGHANY